MIFCDSHAKCAKFMWHSDFKTTKDLSFFYLLCQIDLLGCLEILPKKVFDQKYCVIKHVIFFVKFNKGNGQFVQTHVDICDNVCPVDINLWHEPASCDTLLAHLSLRVSPYAQVTDWRNSLWLADVKRMSTKHCVVIGLSWQQYAYAFWCVEVAGNKSCERSEINDMSFQIYAAH